MQRGHLHSQWKFIFWIIAACDLYTAGSKTVRPEAADALRFVEAPLPADQSSQIVAAPVRFRQVPDGQDDSY